MIKPSVVNGKQNEAKTYHIGNIPTVSSDIKDPSKGALLWAISVKVDDSSLPPHVYLHAYNAEDLTANGGNGLFRAKVGQWDAVSGRLVLSPTVINGKVYVVSLNKLSVLGNKNLL